MVLYSWQFDDGEYDTANHSHDSISNIIRNERYLSFTGNFFEQVVDLLFINLLLELGNGLMFSLEREPAPLPHRHPLPGLRGHRGASVRRPGVFWPADGRVGRLLGRVREQLGVRAADVVAADGRPGRRRLLHTRVGRVAVPGRLRLVCHVQAPRRRAHPAGRHAVPCRGGTRFCPMDALPRPVRPLHPRRRRPAVGVEPGRRAGKHVATVRAAHPLAGHRHAPQEGHLDHAAAVDGWQRFDNGVDDALGVMRRPAARPPTLSPGALYQHALYHKEYLQTSRDAVLLRPRAASLALTGAADRAARRRVAAGARLDAVSVRAASAARAALSRAAAPAVCASGAAGPHNHRRSHSVFSPSISLFIFIGVIHQARFIDTNLPTSAMQGPLM